MEIVGRVNNVTKFASPGFVVAADLLLSWVVVAWNGMDESKQRQEKEENLG